MERRKEDRKLGKERDNKGKEGERWRKGGKEREKGKRRGGKGEGRSGGNLFEVARKHILCCQAAVIHVCPQVGHLKRSG